jgi:hypothetical protein
MRLAASSSAKTIRAPSETAVLAGPTTVVAVRKQLARRALPCGNRKQDIAKSLPAPLSYARLPPTTQDSVMTRGSRNDIRTSSSHNLRYTISDPCCRALWAAVVLQAKEDVRNAAFDSLIYNDAEAFFVGGGDWRYSRAHAAEQLDMEPERLAKLGRSWVNKRRLAENAPARDAKPAVQYTPMPMRMPPQEPVRAISANPELTHERLAATNRASARRWKRGDGNPFNPFRKVA